MFSVPVEPALTAMFKVRSTDTAPPSAIVNVP